MCLRYFDFSLVSIGPNGLVLSFLIFCFLVFYLRLRPTVPISITLPSVCVCMYTCLCNDHRNL